MVPVQLLRSIRTRCRPKRQTALANHFRFLSESSSNRLTAWLDSMCQQIDLTTRALILINNQDAHCTSTCATHTTRSHGETVSAPNGGFLQEGVAEFPEGVQQISILQSI